MKLEQRTVKHRCPKTNKSVDGRRCEKAPPNLNQNESVQRRYRAAVKQTLFLSKASPNFNIRSERGPFEISPRGINYRVYSIFHQDEAESEYSKLEATRKGTRKPFFAPIISVTKRTRNYPLHFLPPRPRHDRGKGAAQWQLLIKNSLSSFAKENLDGLCVNRCSLIVVIRYFS